jgi:hypothetical protein
MEGQKSPHITPRGAFVYTGVKEPASFHDPTQFFRSATFGPDSISKAYFEGLPATPAAGSADFLFYTYILQVSRNLCFDANSKFGPKSIVKRFGILAS